VIVVLGLLVGIAGIPAVDSGEQGLQQGELYVRDAIHTARARAMATRQTHGVAFDLSQNRFIVLAGDGTAVSDPFTHKDYLIEFDRPDMPSNLALSAVDFGTTGPAAIFDAQGDPVSGGTVTLACQQSSLVLELDGATGWLDVQ
jgi:hypothetical protein